MPAKEDSGDLWGTLGRLETHPIRISIVEVLLMDGGRRLSPKELSFELQQDIGTVNYHVHELRRMSILDLTDEQKVRGTMEHFYRIAEKFLEDLQAASKGTGGPKRRGRGA